MRTWRGYFVVGVLLGAVVGITGIYTESAPLRLIGAVLTLMTPSIGFAIGRRRRQAQEER